MPGHGGIVVGHCASVAGPSFLSDPESAVLLSWGKIAVPTEKELASSSCGAVRWGQPGLTPPAWPPPCLASRGFILPSAASP